MVAAQGLAHLVTQRGNRRQMVFFSDAGYAAFVEWLDQELGRPRDRQFPAGKSPNFNVFPVFARRFVLIRGTFIACRRPMPPCLRWSGSPHLYYIFATFLQAPHPNIGRVQSSWPSPVRPASPS